ncbi:hypothetical protein [Pedobacter boryungensis]|uniref:Lipoprotein n=1 Tax=Pedobacter boryungensis TaxID=869962 RepID=A0ABX2DC14_9SPHI|nr:hypothetical protein [Pedobacter boryungensis]NQX31485.1 hypothetical protein [Pedobacter boryungensis]
MKCKTIAISFVVLCVLFLSACNSDSNKEKKITDPSEMPENNLSFKDVNGIRFYEVKRRFKNGLSFNEIGFQQEPTWTIEFKAPDTMLAYSPEIARMQGFYLQHDHEKVYNFAREFFRAKIISRDSLILQRLQVNGKQIMGDDDERSDVYCTYYTKDYIENKLHTTIEQLKRPLRADTLFIKRISERTYRNPKNPDTAFAARQPVVFEPKSKFITAKKISTVDELNHRPKSYDYLYPEYEIEILRSYKEFAYNFTVVVDATGKMHLNRLGSIVLPEYLEARKKLIQGIIDVYLQNLLKITPGKTLGIPHSSEITLTVTGKRSK